jgi:ferredoxin
VSAPHDQGLRVVVNRDLCQGYANCLDAAPDAFDLDEHDIAVPRRHWFPPEAQAQLERAVDRCPARALHLEPTERGVGPG